MNNKNCTQQLLIEYINKAGEYYYSDEYDKLDKITDKILMIDSLNGEALKFKFTSLLKLSKFEDALLVADRIIENNPKNQDAYYQKGKILYKLKRYKESSDCFDRVYEMNLDNININAYTQHAKALVELGEYKRALWACEYSKRNQKNGFYFGEDEIKLEIHKRIICDFEKNGLFGNRYVFKSMEHMEYIQINKDSVKITVPEKDIVFDSKGDMIIKRRESFTVGEVKEQFVNLQNSNFLEWITNDYDLHYYYRINNKTKVLVKPVYYLNPGDRILSSYFTGNYQWESYVYSEGIYEVLLGSECLGYVFRK
ncbi:tetratricopeptide repeat protein [Clostridium cibarium]|uniref:CDC27 family protein n=1 Tax=Clostridium cibarium TaxID=2762247 RepID=A0ABR8PXP9_9CLOT|nr:CDC27 family protein [Clostridium cibarium]MBD7912947.1 CDC27 family protein [Clostridium cibarium]